MTDETKTRTVLNRLQKTVFDAIILIVDEQEHHALSYRSASMMNHYAQILPAFYRRHLDDLTDDQKSNLARWLQWVQMTLASSIKEQARDYEYIKRRTVIVLSDIVENAIESVMAACLRNLDTSQLSIRDLTGHKGKVRNERYLKLAIRKWESRLFEKNPSRVNRFEKMLASFFPKYQLPPTVRPIDELVRRRNIFTHELIVVTDNLGDEAIRPSSTNQEIDDFLPPRVT